jgi:hypothetical protein
MFVAFSYEKLPVMPSFEYEILPNVGLGTIRFGDKMESFIKSFGKPDEVDNIDEDEEMNITVLHYWEKGLSIFFVGLETQLLAGIETDHTEVRLYDEWLMGRTEEEIVDLMRSNGHNSFETETEENDKRLSFDISMMDFFFRDGKLVYMNFGVFVDANGKIEPVPA